MTSRPLQNNGTEDRMAAPNSPRLGRRPAMLGPRIGYTAIAIALALVVLAALLPDHIDVTNPLVVSLAWIAFAIETVQFHAGMIAGVFALFAFLRRRRRAAITLAMFAILCIAPSIPNFIPQRAPPTGSTIRVMSLNLRCGGYDPDTVLAQVTAANPDIMCFQEYNAEGHARLMPLLSPRFAHHVVAPTDQTRGTAVFSRLPFRVSSSRTFDLGQNGGSQIAVTVELSGREVQIYCVHLAQPARFARFARQYSEVARLLEILAAAPGPALVVGDLNATNQTYSARLLGRSGFVDASASIGGGFQWTWPTYRRLPWLRLLRLDHIFLSRELSARRAEVLPYAGSDHRPVLAEVGFRLDSSSPDRK